MSLPSSVYRASTSAAAALLLSLATAMLPSCGADTTSTGVRPTADGGPPGSCPAAKNTASLQGTIDGTKVDQSYAAGHVVEQLEHRWHIGTGGSLWILLAARGQSPTGGYLIQEAHLVMPAESMLAGKLFCASGGFLESDAHSSIPTLGSYSFSLTGLQLSDGNGDSEPCNPAVDEFNPNPRTPPIVRPVMGEISGCFGPTKQ